MTNVINKCKYYQRGRKCTYSENCAEKYGLDVCRSNLYYAMDLEEQVKELKEWKDGNQATGICETCTDKSVQDAHKYKILLQSIKSVLEYYANSKIGEENEFGMSICKITQSCSGTTLTGDFVLSYNPMPAKKWLEELNEVLGE